MAFGIASDLYGDQPARLFGRIQPRELGSLEEVHDFAVAAHAVALPLGEHIERHHVRPALPGERIQPAALQAPFPVISVDQNKLDAFGIALASANGPAAARFQAVNRALLDDIPMSQNEFSAVALRIETEDDVDREIVREYAHAAQTCSARRDRARPQLWSWWIRIERIALAADGDAAAT